MLMLALFQVEINTAVWVGFIALFGIAEELVWRISSGFMLAVLVPWLVTYPIRRKKAAPDQKWPLQDEGPGLCS